MKKISGMMLTIVVMLSGCSMKKERDVVYPELYLRSEFTFWEASNIYKFSNIMLEETPGNISKGTKKLTIPIAKDGLAYHIKIADKYWSAQSNCGPKDQQKSNLIIGQWLTLNCSYDHKKYSTTPMVNPIKFNPKTSGIYTFELEVVAGKPQALRVILESVSATK